MRVLLTGGTGLVGSAVARLLTDRGDRVRAVVRDPARAAALHDLGCEVVVSDLSDEGALVGHCAGVDAVVHAAAVHAVGRGQASREELVDTNVCGTERVLGAALTAGVRTAVHVSSVAVFGDTGGRVADEGWVRDPARGWTSTYDRTRTVAHGRALEIGARGLPLVAVQPGLPYGPGDRGLFGRLLARVLDGALPVLAFGDVGLCPVHRDDVAAGVLLALDKGVPGQSYVLAGEPVRLREVVELLAEVSGGRPPRVHVPSSLLRALVPAGGVLGPALGLPPDLRELVQASAGVTYWASSDKAMDELGWSSRPLVEGLVQLLSDR